ncbi:GPI ethanolamine phosphate transferase 3 [Trametes pubescens]|uniref:GPI ethanolamine phosphate transferase 3 n=1 Tax=Trametes pubescens TaxID=154538 RepID=A0A1M2V8L5_TRAPU|nr:GPI ethanolamine phosphate transferase 3 [Trametes pubescens]
MASKGLSLLTWVFFVHLAGIYLYTRGFLLTRLALSDVNRCEDGACTLTPTHKKAVVLVIDALRFDFLSPHPPEPHSPYHHNVITLPQELSASWPTHSFLFEMFSDPPTTTLQRLKGITTGSLPTFIDMGSNFGGSSINEDSFIGQMRRAGKKIAFMGDDTWTTVFPVSFDANMTHAYDSFNVEDLHTVDEGVIEHLFPLLKDKTAPWDLLIGHFLGVDHVGHRVGPDHPTMRTKQQQMDDVLRRVVDLLDDDTLLVLLGDHGMDRKGDHGGDGDHETSAALWVYSKGPQLQHPKAAIPTHLLTTRFFPGATVANRHIQQIDLAPTLSLLLGLPIPFNNLGTVVPELFWHDKAGKDYTRALSLNARQVKQYLQTYRDSASGGELDNAWGDLEGVWQTVNSDANVKDQDAQWLAMTTYTRQALAVCRMLWAQFNVSLMTLGLVLLVTGTVAAAFLYLQLGAVQDQWETWSAGVRRWYVSGVLSGAMLGFLAYITVSRYVKGLGLFEALLFGSALTSSLAILASTRPSLSGLSPRSLMSLPLPLILHALAFASNSFTVWEDHVVTFLLITSIAASALAGFSAPTSRLRYRILGFSALFAACVRLMAMSTVCREEQQPYCHVTFFASSSLPSPPLPVLALSVPVALVLPWILKRFLKISQSDKGTAAIMLPWILPGTLLLGSAYWVLEHLDSSEAFGPEWAGALRLFRTLCARSALGGVIFFGYALWWLAPLCLKISAETRAGTQDKKQVTVLGFANAYGAPYLLFWCLFMGVLYPATQLTGQIVLALAAVAILAHLEVIDSIRDVRSLEAVFASGNPSAILEPDALNVPSIPLRFSEITPLALLAVHAFFATGHQAAIPSIQWKAAFVLTSTLTYPFSPLLVVLNSFGPHFLIALAAPLLALWNVAPLPQPAADVKARANVVRAALGMMLYHATLLLSSAVCSAWLRRHLMVWKIFAPRFMLSALTVVVVDVAVLFGVGVGVGRVSGRVARMFAAMNPK